jgi:hypothetical protein
MARVNKAKKKAAHEYLIKQEQKTLEKKNVKSLQPVKASSPKMKASETLRETRRDKIARKKRESKQRKAPSRGDHGMMEIEERKKVKKTAIHK